MEGHLAHSCTKTDPEVQEVMKARIAAAKANLKLKKETLQREAALLASLPTFRSDSYWLLVQEQLFSTRNHLRELKLLL